MNIDHLFLKTIEDINKRLSSRDEYEVLMIAGLLRKLLTDGDNLIDQVNKNRKLKIYFAINERTSLPQSVALPTYWFVQDGLDPNTSHVSRPKQVSKDQLLKTEVAIIEGKSINVLDIIKFLSHIEGSVHSRNPKDIKEQLIKDTQSIGIGGLPSITSTVLAIGRVVINGLEPLRKTIQ